MVAFSALVNSVTYGIFTGGDAIADKVIQVGDPLFGSVVSDLEFFRSLNHSGQIAFRYALANGVEGIAVATLVPEATTWMLALVGLTGVVWMRPSRRIG